MACCEPLSNFISQTIHHIEELEQFHTGLYKIRLQMSAQFDCMPNERQHNYHALNQLTIN